MAIATYDDIVTQIRRWSNRTDLEDQDVASFIYYAGNSANQVLRVPAMEWSEILTVNEGGKVILPFDFLELKNLTAFWNDGKSVTLDRLAWDQFLSHRNSDNDGYPKYFSRQGPYLWISPAPKSGTKVTIHYYRAMPDISPVEQTNWLSEMSPMSYLYGGLHYAHLFLMDEERAEYWRGKYQAELERIQNLAESTEYKGSSLAVRMKDLSGVR